MPKSTLIGHRVFYSIFLIGLLFISLGKGLLCSLDTAVQKVLRAHLFGEVGSAKGENKRQLESRRFGHRSPFKRRNGKCFL